MSCLLTLSFHTWPSFYGQIKPCHSGRYSILSIVNIGRHALTYYGHEYGRLFCLYKKWLQRRYMVERNLEISSIHFFSLNFVSQNRLSSIKSCLSLKVVFHPWSSSIKGCLPSEAVFHNRLSSIKGCLPSKVVFHQKLSSIKGRLPSKGGFHQRSSSILLYQMCSTMFLNVPIPLTTLQTSL